MRIHELTASALLAALKTRQISAVEATQAHIDRITAINSTYNAVIAHRFELALNEAKACDRARSRSRSQVGPLCGLPITIKDNLNLAGFDSTLGLKYRQNHPATQDAVTVAALRAAGAIILGKTNVPQLLLAQETENRIWGLTRNPWNTERSAGGSSGGEAVAVATGMSPLGIGTDIGGSIRIPAHFCGIYGLKPTVDRWSNRGSVAGVPGQELVRAQMGPMARSTADLTMVMRALDPAGMAASDPGVPPLSPPDPDSVNLAGLRIGYYEDDGFLAPTESIQRSVRTARRALIDAGATLVPYTPPDKGDLIYLWLAALSSDGGRTLSRRLGKEPVSQQLRATKRLAQLPASARQTLARVLNRVGERRASRMIRSLGEKPVAEFWTMTTERTRRRHEALDAWNAAKLDAVICPPHSVPAMGHHMSSDFILSLGYMFRYSLLNMPAGVVPISRVTTADVRPAKTKPDRIDRKLALIDAQSVGLPVGVQVVARPYREDVVLAVMAGIEKVVRTHSDYPLTPIGG